MAMKVISTRDKGFGAFLKAVLARGEGDTTRVEETVKEVLAAVRATGDRAVRDYTRRFDGVELKGSLEVGTKEINAALKRVSKRDLRLLELAAERIEGFHARAVPTSWTETGPDGTTLGVRVTPVGSAAVYVPGGKAAYPSTVLMNVIPARVAGVEEVFMTTPPKGAGRGAGISPYVLAAAVVSGVDRIYRIGGAQAVGAFAYGTRSVPRVDKITGPGNIYVATAKRLVFGTVDIDMVAGPSEILIINDGGGDPAWMAADLLSQAEHDELASPLLVTTSAKTARAVAAEVEIQLKRLKRRAIARSSVEAYGAIIVARDIEEAVELSNRIAPEHLELFCERPYEVMGLVKNAGAIFLGANTPEALGDYLAGPNHTLPTGGTARFSSPLGVEDFMKRSSVIGFSARGLKELGPEAARFAALEGLEAHEKSVKVRLKK